MFKSVSVKIGLAVFAVLTATLSIMIFIFESREQAVTMGISQDIQHVSELTHNFVTYAMDQGIDDVQPIINEIQQVHGIQEIKITPTNIISPNSEINLDDIEKNVLKTRTTFSKIEKTPNGHVLRTVTPLLSRNSCIECHGGKHSEPLAVISARVSLENVRAAVRGQEKTIMLLGAFTLFATVFLTVLLLKKSVITPLKTNTDAIKSLAKGDVSTKLTTKSKDELGVATESIIALQNAIRKKSDAAEQIAHGNLNVDFSIESDKDILGHSMIKMKNSINNMAKEVSTLTSQALVGNLDSRANTQLHEGEFKNIVSGINKTLDAILEPIHQAVIVLKKVAEKDLTVHVTGDYKGDHTIIQNAVNQAIDNLHKSLEQLSVSSAKTASASSQIGSGSEAIAQGASEQASSLEEISGSLHEMATITHRNSANSAEAKTMTDTAQNSAAKGKDCMTRLSTAMNKIKISSDKTSAIIQTIDEIAFQTNLLALNAAVEAARAGESGKGFAVVAEEVRNLAMRSAEAAKNTADMIADAIQNAEAGVLINDEMLTNLKEINDQISNVSLVMNEINDASHQQTEGIEQIDAAVTQMNRVTQNNAANSEESASAAQELAGQSEEMNRLVAAFRLNITNLSINSFNSEQDIQTKFIGNQLPANTSILKNHLPNRTEKNEIFN